MIDTRSPLSGYRSRRTERKRRYRKKFTSEMKFWRLFLRHKTGVVRNRQPLLHLVSVYCPRYNRERYTAKLFIFHLIAVLFFIHEEYP